MTRALTALLLIALAGCAKERCVTTTDYGMIVHPPIVHSWNGPLFLGDHCPRCGASICDPIPGTAWSRVKNHECKGATE